jgi:hypothetical protein
MKDGEAEREDGGRRTTGGSSHPRLTRADIPSALLERIGESHRASSRSWRRIS